MAETREPRLVNDVSEIADKIRFARSDEKTLGKTVFLIGAGCSISAGIPGAVDIAKKMIREVAKRFGCCAADTSDFETYRSLISQKYFEKFLVGDPEKELTEATIDWYKIYDDMFRRHYTAPDDVRDLFANLVSEADGAINWAHLCLGEIVAHNYISTVLTTNFDQLVLSGMVRAGVLPVVCDGIESLNRIAGAPRHPQLVELHGSRHTYLLRNAPEDVEAVKNDSQASAAIQKLLQHATTFIVVGYGGREQGVMDLLIQAADVYRDKNLYWVSYDADPKELSDKPRQFLRASKNSGHFVGQDADKFFLQLCKSLKIGSPRAISRPLDMLERAVEEVSKSVIKDDTIRAEISSAKRRAARLQEYDSTYVDNLDPIEAKISLIRENRLAGNRGEAYRLAKEALKELSDEEPDP